MTVDLRKILESKRTLRRALATLPVSEKLRLLEIMRERELAIRPVSQIQRMMGAVRPPTAPRRLGFLAGEIEVPDDFDRMGEDEIAALFGSEA